MIQKILLPCLILLFAQALSAQTIRLRGKVTDAETAAPLSDASVVLSTTGKLAATGADGRFVLEGLTTGKFMLVITHAGFQPLEKEVTIKDINPVLEYSLLRDPATVTNPVASSTDIPTVSLEEADSETDGASEVANVLNASRDVFQQVSGFGWSTFRFRERGYDGQYFQTFVNGVPFNDLETGFTAYGELGGLNDVVRLRSTTVGLDAAEFFVRRPGWRYHDRHPRCQPAQADPRFVRRQQPHLPQPPDGYHEHRTHAGRMAVSASASHRWAQEGYVAGTFMDAWAYFLSVDKKFNDKHSLNLAIFGAPTKRGRSADSFQEMLISAVPITTIRCGATGTATNATLR